MKKTIPVIGMACASCSANVERKLNSLDGIQQASVSLPGRSALVDYDPARISLEDMKRAINGIGYDLVIEADRSAVEIERRAYTLLMPLPTWTRWCVSPLPSPSSSLFSTPFGASRLGAVRTSCGIPISMLRS